MSGRSPAAVLCALAVALATGCGSDDDSADPRVSAHTTTAPEASITCDGYTTQAGTTRVRVKADGIHLRVENTSGRELGWAADVQGVGGTGSSAPAGRSSHVLDLPPGPLRFACYDERRDDPSEVPRVRVEVVDPDALWLSTAIDCDRHVTIFATHEAGTAGDVGAPADLVRERLRAHGKLRPGDRVERAGYPEVTQPTRVRLVRDGAVVAVFRLVRAQAGGWLQSSVQHCQSAGLD